MLRAADAQRGRGETGQPDRFDTAVAIMLQRGVPNKLHYLDPVALDNQTWDEIPDELQRAIVRCTQLRVKATVDDYTPEARRKLQAQYERMAERTIRAYLEHVRPSRAS